MGSSSSTEKPNENSNVAPVLNFGTEQSNLNNPTVVSDQSNLNTSTVITETSLKNNDLNKDKIDQVVKPSDDSLLNKNESNKIVDADKKNDKSNDKNQDDKKEKVETKIEKVQTIDQYVPEYCRQIEAPVVKKNDWTTIVSEISLKINQDIKAQTESENLKTTILKNQDTSAQEQEISKEKQQENEISKKEKEKEISKENENENEKDDDENEKNDEDENEKNEKEEVLAVEIPVDPVPVINEGEREQEDEEGNDDLNVFEQLRPSLGLISLERESNIKLNPVLHLKSQLKKHNQRIFFENNGTQKYDQKPNHDDKNKHPVLNSNSNSKTKTKTINEKTNVEKNVEINKNEILNNKRKEKEASGQRRKYERKIEHMQKTINEKNQQNKILFNLLECRHPNINIPKNFVAHLDESLIKANNSNLSSRKKKKWKHRANSSKYPQRDLILCKKPSSF